MRFQPTSFLIITFLLSFCLVNHNAIKNDDVRLDKLQKIMKNMVKINEEQIKKFQLGQYEDPRIEMPKQILDDIKVIYDLSIEVFDNLAKNRKQDLITGLENVLKLIPEIEARLKYLNPKTELGKWLPDFLNEIAKLFKDGFTAILNKAHGRPYTPVYLEQYLSSVSNLCDRFIVIWENLLAKDKGLLKDNFEELVSLDERFLDELGGIKPITIPGQLLLELVKGIWRKFMAQNSHYVKTL